MDGAQSRPEFSVGGILRDWGEEYRRTHAVTTSQARAMEALAACRTAALGGHLEQCDGCGFQEFIRRFLLHLLPAGFRKIRFYGLLAGKGKAERLAACRRLLGAAAPAAAVAQNPTADCAEDAAAAEESAAVCPRCGGKMTKSALPPATGPCLAPGPALCTPGTGPPGLPHAA